MAFHLVPLTLCWGWAARDSHSNQRPCAPVRALVWAAPGAGPSPSPSPWRSGGGSVRWPAVVGDFGARSHHLSRFFFWAFGPFKILPFVSAQQYWKHYGCFKLYALWSRESLSTSGLPLTARAEIPFFLKHLFRNFPCIKCFFFQLLCHWDDSSHKLWNLLLNIL